MIDIRIGRGCSHSQEAASSQITQGDSRMGKMYRHPAMKQLKDQQTRYAPRERRLEQIDRAEQLLNEIEDAKRYPYEYLCYRITGFRPEGWPALVLEGGDVQHDLRLFVEDVSATARQAVEQVAEPVLTVDEVGRRYSVSATHGDTMASTGVGGASIRHRRPHQSGVPRVELAAICHGPSHASRTGLTVSATDRGGAGRDHSSRPSHGARPPRAGRPGRDRPEDRTQDVTLNRNGSIDPESLRPRSPRPGDLPVLGAVPGRRRQGADLPAVPHGRLGRGLGPPVRPDALERLRSHQRDACPTDPRDQARIHRQCELPRARRAPR